MHLTGFDRFKPFLGIAVLLLIFSGLLQAMPTQDNAFVAICFWSLVGFAALSLICGVYAAAKPSLVDQEIIHEHEALENARRQAALESASSSRRGKHKKRKALKA